MAATLLDHFQNTGVPARADLPEDRGREAGARMVREDPINCRGPYSDAEPADCTELTFLAPDSHEMLRAFKPPSLRGVRSRPPMHAGQIATLKEVIEHYSEAPEAPRGHSELRPLGFSAIQQGQIETFLRSLESASVPDVCASC